jgi:hypothetical protein
MHARVSRDVTLAAAEGAAMSDAVLQTAAALAKACRISLRTARRWIALGCPRPPCRHGEVLGWLADRRRAERQRRRDAAIEPRAAASATADPEMVAELRRAQARFRRAKTRLARIENQVRRGVWVPRADVVGLLVGRVQEICAGLDTMALRVSRRFDRSARPEVAGWITREVRELRESFAAGRGYPEGTT